MYIKFLRGDIESFASCFFFFKYQLLICELIFFLSAILSNVCHMKCSIVFIELYANFCL